MSGLEQRLSNYMSSVYDNVYGWLGGKAVEALRVLADYQNGYGIKGDALEIGVFQGKFFLALAAAIEADNIVVGIDIFSEQSLNVDKSGRRTRIFLRYSRITSNASRPIRTRSVSSPPIRW